MNRGQDDSQLANGPMGPIDEINFEGPSSRESGYQLMFTMGTQGKSDSRSLEVGIEVDNVRIENWKPTIKEWLILLTLTTSSLVASLEASILVSVLPTLAQDLHGSAIDAFWTGTSYLLTHAMLQPFLASLSNIFGRREVLFSTLLLSLIGSIVCGTAHDFTAMLVGRIIQGIGGAGVISLAQVVTADIVPLRQRPKYFSVVYVAWTIGTVAGPVVGGGFVKATWRWCFWLSVPICTIALLMTVTCVNLTTTKLSLRTKLASMDWVGNFLFIASITGGLIAISWGGVQFAWKSAQTLVPLVLVVVGLTACLIWERYYAKEPFLTKSLFPTVSAVVLYISAVLSGLSLYMTLYYIPFYFTSVQLKGPVGSAVALLPAAVFVVPGAIVVSQLITRLGTFRWAIWMGWVISTIGSGLLIRYDTTTSKAYWGTAEAILGVGLGMILTSVNFAIQATVRPIDVGRAVAMYAFFRSVGMALGVGIGGIVFQNIMQNELIRLGVESAQEIAKNAVPFVTMVSELPENDPLRIAVLQGYVKGSQGTFAVMTGFCGLGLILSLFVKHSSMDQLFVTKHKSR